MVYEVSQDIHGQSAQMDWELDRSLPGGISQEMWHCRHNNIAIPEHLLRELPKEVWVFDVKTQLTDVLGGGWLYVSPRFKAAVEEFEPGKFQFFPVHLNGKKQNGEAIDETYYICHDTGGYHDILEQIDFNHSDLHWDPPPRLPRRFTPPPNAPDKFLMRNGERRLGFLKERIAGLHFWSCSGTGGGTSQCLCPTS